MPYYFDNWGWLTTEPIVGRETDSVPPQDVPEGHAANWTGHKWIVLPYVEPQVVVPKKPNPTRRQMKLALLQVGLLDTLEAAIAASGDRVLQISYGDALDFDRESPLVLGMAQVLNQTEAELDMLWDMARSL